MKKIIIGAGVIIISSLKAPPTIVPCSEKVLVEFYSNGKLVTSDHGRYIIQKSIIIQNSLNGKIYDTDSVVFSVYKPKK